MTNPVDLLNVLRSQNCRITPVRASLVRLFCQAAAPVSAQALAAQLDPAPHKTTLYRELQFLVERQIVQEVDFGDQLKRYELSGKQHHHHAVCTSCHQVTDVTVANLCPVESAVAQQTGFTKVKHALEFFGLCPRCSS